MDKTTAVRKIQNAVRVAFREARRMPNGAKAPAVQVSSDTSAAQASTTLLKFRHMVQGRTDGMLNCSGVRGRDCCQLHMPRRACLTLTSLDTEAISAFIRNGSSFLSHFIIMIRTVVLACCRCRRSAALRMGWACTAPTWTWW